MKLIPTATVLILLSSVTGPCSNQDKTQVINSPATPSSDEQDNPGLPTIPYDEMLAKVVSLSKQAGIPSLKDSRVADGQIELRVWKAFGLTYPRCFILTVANGSPAASLRAPKIAGRKGVFRNGNPVYATIQLSAPHSGWESFLAHLKENGVGSSVDLSLDKRYIPDPDAEELVLEMKNGSHHSMAYYADSTETANGKKAFAVCKEIRNEFDINLGCQ